ncbi:hypothetical protein GALMADRAFT_1248570 [Galerina marginata CBS 339.88]|uniref:Uncharacterized protein n=1 Tax=Galerina marginata (strain CBS 339.88) TaxID=685588 RepID=A0A067SFZ1_GALM3|nr:hypothetical protein GALMADRAFT_1248570 [Galerina marginata CBS 339.88]
MGMGSTCWRSFHGRAFIKFAGWVFGGGATRGGAMGQGNEARRGAQLGADFAGALLVLLTGGRVREQAMIGKAEEVNVWLGRVVGGIAVSLKEIRNTSVVLAQVTIAPGMALMPMVRLLPLSLYISVTEVKSTQWTFHPRRTIFFFIRLAFDVVTQNPSCDRCRSPVPILKIEPPLVAILSILLILLL